MGDVRRSRKKLQKQFIYPQSKPDSLGFDSNTQSDTVDSNSWASAPLTQPTDRQVRGTARRLFVKIPSYS